MRRSALVLFTVAAAVACTSGGSPASPTPAITAELVPTDQGPAESGALPRLVPGERSTVGVLLQHFGRLDGFAEIGSRAGDSALVALDVTSGELIAGWGPLALHRYANRAVASPDGQMLAMAGRDDRGAPTVQVVDLDQAQGSGDPIQPTSRGSDGDPRAIGIGPMRWSADGANVYWLQSTYLLVDQLWRLDVGSGDARAIANLEGTGLDEPMLSPDGKTVYLLRRPCCELREGGTPYEVIAIDAATGEEVARTSVPGVVHRAPTNGIEYLPAAAIAPDGSGSAIHVVHADADRVTTIATDPLVAGEPREFRAQGSAFSRLGGWLLDRFASRAEAKVGEQTKVALVSADGRRLYITGATDELCEFESHSYCVIGDPLGLQVVDLETMQLLHHERGVDRITLTADGRWVIGGGSVREWDDVEQRTLHEGFGLTVFDAVTGEPVGAFDRGAIVGDVAVSPDSRRLYYLVPVGPTCASTCSMLRVVDLDEQRIIASRELGSRPVGLVDLGGR
jgi:hypothetical protein